MLQKTHKLSNLYYNSGLAKAKVRDLTGAIFVLKKSLEINKRNINARNLLGLIYFEMGDTVAALSEWIISKHFDPDNNDSDYYIQSIQSNPTQLDILNQTIKKYNVALNLANQGDDDLAIIQLRKVINLNPRFVKALQLLSLLYIHNEEYSKAYKYLKRAREIDVSNTITLRYIKEIKDNAFEAVSDRRKKSRGKQRSISNEKPASSQTFTASPYKEDKPNILVFISLIAGIIIGVVACVVLIIPTVKNEAINEFRNSEVEYNAQISQKDQEIASLSRDKEGLEEEVTRLELQASQLERAKQEAEQEADNSNLEKLLEATMLYLDGTSTGQLDYVAVAEDLSNVDVNELDNLDGVNIYNNLKDVVYIEASNLLYRDGYIDYEAKRYEEALEKLLKAHKYNPTNVNATYFLGRSYERLDNDAKAKEFYTILVDEYPATRRGTQARTRLKNLE